MGRVSAGKLDDYRMKAYEIYDNGRYSDYTVIVFAESRGKAISYAIGTDEFPKYDWEFTELRARRIPELDKAYRGAWRMEWDNDDDRLALVRDAGCCCGEDAFYPEDCEQCVGKEYCSRYEEYMEEIDQSCTQ